MSDPIPRITKEGFDESFDVSVDNATHAVVEEFSWVGLPSGDKLGDLMIEINGALSTVMARYKGDCLFADWQYEVANGDTRLGYGEWLELRGGY